VSDPTPFAPLEDHPSSTTQVVSIGRVGLTVSRRQAAAAVGVALIATIAAVVLWRPWSGGADDPRFVAIGSVADYPVGSVTALEIDDAWFDHLALEGPAEFQDSRIGPHRVHGARLLVTNRSDEIRVLLARSPYMGCRLSADEDTARSFADIYDADPSVAVIADECHGGVFAADGRHLCGVGERDLDYFPVHYDTDGHLTIDLTDVRRGAMPATP